MLIDCFKGPKQSAGLRMTACTRAGGWRYLGAGGALYRTSPSKSVDGLRTDAVERGRTDGLARLRSIGGRDTGTVMIDLGNALIVYMGAV